MRYRHFLFALVLVLPASVAHAIEPSDLKPGLIASYSDGPKGGAREAMRLEPTVAIALAKGETPHPSLASGSVMVWKGYINIARAGKYKFDATVQGGKLTAKVDGKSVLGAEYQSEGGVVPFEATFTRDTADGPARVELFWQGPGFIKEPLAYQFLGHLPKDRTATFTKAGTLEHGRFKFEELSCAKCHAPAANDKMAKTLV